MFHSLGKFKQLFALGGWYLIRDQADNRKRGSWLLNIVDIELGIQQSLQLYCFTTIIVCMGGGWIISALGKVSIHNQYDMLGPHQTTNQFVEIEFPINHDQIFSSISQSDIR